MRGTALAPVLLALSAGSPALAQAPASDLPPAQPQTPAPETPSPQPPQPQTTTVAPVVVAAQRPAVQQKVDRTAYAVSQDLEAQLGSLADVLRNLPSVDVDLDGNPSIRGDSSVQILVNGHPAPMLNGADRGAILQMLGVDNIQSIEVITNPSARFPPDGAAGIINIVTKSPFAPAPTGVARANWESEGGYNFGLNGSGGGEPLSFNGGVNLRDDARKRVTTNDRSYIDAADGEPAASDQGAASNAMTFSRSARLGADYTPTKADTLSLELDWHDRGGDPKSYEHDVIADPVEGNSDYWRDGTGKDYGVDTDQGLTWRRTLGGDDHEFSVDLERSESLDRDHAGYVDVYAYPVQPDTLDEIASRTDEVTDQVNLDYKGPLAGGKVEAGYALRVNDNQYDNYGGSIDPATLARASNPELTNRFHLDQAIHAVYGTFEQPLGRWTALAGLRLEETLITADQQTSGETVRNSYFHAYPSLHLQYALSDTQSLKLSYTLRASRPSPDDLNPYLTYQDAFDVRSGNPDLQPQVTEAVEASWAQDDRGGSRSATLYWRETYDTIVDVSRYVSPAVLLTTKANLGQINSTGVDLAATGKPGKALSYTLNGWLFYNQVDASDPGFSGRKVGFGYSGKFTVDWRPTAKDQFQFSGNYNGERLSPGGYLMPTGGADVGYRRQLTPALAAVVDVNDLFDSRIQRTQYDVPTASSLQLRQPQGRTATVGLVWRPGGRPG